MKEKRSSRNFEFLSPYFSIRSENLSKRDVRNVKISLGRKIGVACLIGAIVFLLFDIALLTIFCIKTNFHVAEHYGRAGVWALSISISGAGLCTIFELISLKMKDSKKKLFFNHLGSSLFYVGVAVQMILSLHADAMMGYLTSEETVSASIILYAVLILLQPVFWSEAAVLDSLTVGFFIAVAFHNQQEHGLEAIHYYVLISIGFLVCAYIMISVLFYAETQRYCQELRNDRLYNKASYDELTLCKNRYALNEFVEENHRKWELRSSNILVIMFDIDSFKEYNDQFSHLGGDYCLKTITNGVRELFKTPNLDFFRYGGEEFLLFLEPKTKGEAMENILLVKDCVKDLNIEAPKGAPESVVTISAGGTLITTPVDFKLDHVIEIVDKYLFKAKAAGKNCCCLDDKILR